MTIKMGRWSPWPLASAAGSRRFRVAVKPARIDGLAEGDESEAAQDSFLAVRVKWKGEPRLFPAMAPFQSRQKREISCRKKLQKRPGFVEWDEDRWFENTCCFSVVSNNDVVPRFGAWEIAFSVLHSSEKMDSKAKAAVIGRTTVNLSEIASKMEKSSIEQKLPLSLQIDGISTTAFLTVLYNFIEIRDPQEPAAITRAGPERVTCTDEPGESAKARGRSLSLEEVGPDESNESSPFEARDVKWFSWKNRRFYTFKRVKTKEDKFDEKSGNAGDGNPPSASISSEKQDAGDGPEGAWEREDLTSRDGQAKLTTPVFFASFDQRSPRAAGEGACTALVAVISHWLLSNHPEPIPDRPQLDSLIIHGSSAWQNLCRNSTYSSHFPNRHFDLDTILRARIRPISISPDRSFVGFFGPERFESLRGAMSFDEIWNEITLDNNNNNKSEEPRVYIVSWNDHFFVLKVEWDRYYVIDTLGERLFEGCDRGYILKFDESSVIEIKEEGIIKCGGKECCREFFKRFLAGIPLKEMEEEETRSGDSNFSIHRRLQIEFDYAYLLPSSDSSNSWSLDNSNSWSLDNSNSSSVTSSPSSSLND